MTASNEDFAELLKAEARRLGFDQVGIAPAVRAPGFDHYQDWLELGYQAGMEYMRTGNAARRDLNSVLPGVRSVIVGAIVYGEKSEPSDDPRRGKIARYAQGGDYHTVMWRKLESLLAWITAERPEIRGRAVADTAPILERDYAQMAGLGWIGKNTMLIGRKLGSFTVLGSLLLDCELPYDEPHASSHCGTCTRCLDACPTDAFDGPNRLDANKCISYWTIEHRGPIPTNIAESLDGWVFGCDICQDVCPWNRKAPPGREPALAGLPEWTNPDLISWLETSEDEFRSMLKGTALKRTKWTGLMRNAALVLGARRVREAEQVLRKLRSAPDAGIQEAANWALQRIDEVASEVSTHRQS